MKKFLTILLGFIAFNCFGQDFNAYRDNDNEIGSFATGDFNGDGYMDIIGISYRSGEKANIYLCTNKKENPISFTFSLLLQNTPFLGGPAATDLDGDGDLDLVYASGSDFALNALINDGTGVFTIRSLGVSGTSTLSVSDIDNDGDKDIVGINYNPKRINVYTNNGGLAFTSKTIYNTTKNLKSIGLADFDNDGDVDVLAGLDEFFNEQVVIFQNNGNSNYVRKDIQKNDFPYLSNIVAADVNKDGRTDILATSLDGVWIWENKGSLTFDKKELDTPSDFYFIGASVADYTGEGNPDIVVGTNKEFQWYKNISLVDYSYEQRIMNGLTGAFDITSVDLNNDGALDVVTSNGSLWWYQNIITQLPSGLKEIEIKDYHVYPNPISTEINIKGLEGDGYTIAICNTLGQEILKTSLTNGRANVSSLTAGHYIMTIIDKDGNIVGKESVVKE